MWRDLERICGEAGIPWARPSVFPRNGLHAARVACVAAAEPWLPDFVRGVYRANFAEDRDIAAPEVIRELLENLGQDAAGIVSSLLSFSYLSFTLNMNMTIAENFDRQYSLLLQYARQHREAASILETTR